jgi:hypothetical protein
MAKFNLELPSDLMKDLKKVYDDSDRIFGEMTRAGAEVVESNVQNNAPQVLKSHVKVSRTYHTPTDGGINTKVYISGYIPFSDPNRKYFSRKGGSGKTYKTSDGVPADFLAQIYEYGRSTAPFPKKPFLRKSFKKDQIEQAMLETQKKASGGILDE